MCVLNSFFTRFRRVSLLHGRNDDRCVYNLERSGAQCSLHCSSILEQISEERTMSDINTRVQFLCLEYSLQQDRVDQWCEELEL